MQQLFWPTSRPSRKVVAEYRLTPLAEADLRAIWQTIAHDSQTAADALLIRLLARLDLAASQPLMGMARPELSPTARLLVEGSYIVIYEPAPFGVLAVAIVHGMRDPQSLLA